MRPARISLYRTGLLNGKPAARNQLSGLHESGASVVSSVGIGRHLWLGVTFQYSQKSGECNISGSDRADTFQQQKCPDVGRQGARAAFPLRVRRKAAMVGLPRTDLRKKTIPPRA